MKRVAALSLAMALLASPSLAAATCSSAPPTQWQPQSKVVDMLKAEGLSVVQIKVENGCFEVYAKDGNGNRVNRAYNAETLEMLDNAEAGEG